MLLINANNEYPRHIGDLQLDYPDWQKGDALPDGWREVVEVPVPSYDVETQTFEELQPKLVSGVLTQQFKVRSMTAEELRYRKLVQIKFKVQNDEPLTADEAALLVG